MTQNSFPKIEEDVLKFWQKNQIFKKSLEKPLKQGDFVFYDGPPFATGLPHYGHIIASAIKDVIPRYKTMQGFRANRRWGWDCHGLPIENLIEKELELKTKKDIEKLGIDKFNQACRDSVLRYADEWKKFIPRMGRWVDMENDYRTMDNRYIEVIWWIFKELYKDGLIYEGYKSMHLCPRCETTLSNFEVTLGYKEVKDLAVIVKFKVQSSKFKVAVQNLKLSANDNIYLLTWTTTPWTLPGNMALAINDKIKYQISKIKNINQNSKIKDELAYYIIAADRVKDVMKDKEYDIIGEIKGSKLVGLEYKPLFDFINAGADLLGQTCVSARTQPVGADPCVCPVCPTSPTSQHENHKNAFKIYPADFVSTAEGTGIVHIAPGFGEDDYQLSQKFNIPFLQHVNRDGVFKDYVKPWAGQKVREKDDDQKINIEIIKWLAHHNQLFAKEKYLHSYPHCWRCDTPLLNYATSSWFVKIDDDFKKRLLKANSKVKWVPEHLKDGRFGKWLEGARDWAISRSRYWGAPMPVWRCEKCQNIKVIGSIKEFLENKISDKKPEILASSKDLVHSSVRNAWHRENIIKHNKKFVKRKENNLPAEGLAPSKDSMSNVPLHYATDILPLYQNYQSQAIDLHKPYIDENKLQCDKCQNNMKRIPEVFDCWFESGSMPYASALNRLDGNLENADLTQKVDLSQMSRKDLLKHIEFPADFIAEGIDQTRGWFYTLLVLGVGLYNQSPFKNVAVNGIILAEDGQKMSKRLKNYPDPNNIINKYGADALRFYLLSSPAVRGESLNFSEKGVDEVYKKFVLLILNVLKFWKTYSNNFQFSIFNFQSISKDQFLISKHILDQWILARLSQLIGEVEESLDNYEIDKACRPITEFIADLSTWYLRRSRERFKDGREDSQVAISTLGYVLGELSKVLAPICPFLTEHIYQNVKCQNPNVNSMSNVKIQISIQGKESVHLENWPQINSKFKIQSSKLLLDSMQAVRQICEMGHSLRDIAGIKVRQVLKNFQFSIFNFQSISKDKFSIFKQLIADELNIKNIEIVEKLPEGEGWISKEGAALYIVIDDELREEGIVRELTRQINNLRKKQGLTIDDQVILEYATESEQLRQIIKKYQQNLKQAVLAREIKNQKDLEGEKLQMEGKNIVIKLSKLRKK